MSIRTISAPDRSSAGTSCGQEAATAHAVDLQISKETNAADLRDDWSKPLTIGLIDCYRFSQECLTRVFESLDPRIKVHGFESVDDCSEKRPAGLSLLIYYSHDTNAAEAALTQAVLGLRGGFPDIPLIVLSDAEDAHQRKTIRTTLSSGAQGFIPTRTTGIPVAIAAIRLIKAGGTFAPLDLLLRNRPDQPALPSEPTVPTRLTSRQTLVLAHLQEGKANKMIARELGMSESTVKVHVRDIMRRMGAANRTEVAYKAQKRSGYSELSTPSD
jgi:DNA-binding NarL/FixJ family response regulator